MSQLLFGGFRHQSVGIRTGNAIENGRKLRWSLSQRGEIAEKVTIFLTRQQLKVLENSIFVNAVPVLKADRSDFNWRT